ncbi:MAG: hypothetical protein QOI80_555 [Solirubrobacteraceae bacterium]|nr:hypothetical protein [Solirubrobacteraceae bacterium]
MRPLSIGELLDAAFAAVRRNFGTLVLCTLVVVVPVAIINTLISASSSDAAFDFTTTNTISEDEIAPYVAGTLATSLLSLLAQTLTAAACLRTIGGDVVGAPAGAAESLRYAAKRLGPLIWISILYALALVVGVLMCFVGVVWLGVLFCLATPALLFEEARGGAAMRRSRQLIEDHWWRVFGALVVGYLIVAVLQGILGALVGGVILAQSDSELTNAVLVTLVSIVGFALSLPFASALLTYIYFDLRVRKEGFDLQLLAQRIGAPGGGTGLGASDVTESGLPAADAQGSSGFLPPQPPPGA